MKNLLTIALLFTSLLGYSQDVPKAVKGAFEKQHPNAVIIQWEKLENASWRVFYKIKTDRYRSEFTEGGQWIETRYEISIDDIPEKVRLTLDRKYPQFDISTVELIKSTGINKYLIFIGEDELNQEVLINENGIIIWEKDNREEIEFEEEEIDDINWY